MKLIDDYILTFDLETKEIKHTCKSGINPYLEGVLMEEIKGLTIEKMEELESCYFYNVGLSRTIKSRLYRKETNKNDIRYCLHFAMFEMGEVEVSLLEVSAGDLKLA